MIRIIDWIGWYELDEAGILDVTIRHVQLWFVGTQKLAFWQLHYATLLQSDKV